MYDLDKLPYILETAGIISPSLTTWPNALLNNWSAALATEINVRNLRKRQRDANDSASGSAVQRSQSSSNISLPDSDSFFGIGSGVGMDSESVSAGADLNSNGDELDSHSLQGVHGHVPDQRSCDMTIEWPDLPNQSDSLVPVDSAGRPNLPEENDDERLLKYLRSLPHEELVQLSLRQVRQIRGLKHKSDDAVSRRKKVMRRFGQKTRRLKQSLRKQKTKLKESKTRGLDGLDVFRSNSHRLTWRGSISLGLRKAIALASASTFPQASLLEVARQTVTRAELLVDELFITRTIVFNRFAFALLTTIHEMIMKGEGEQGGEQGEPSDLALVPVLKDASNTGIVKSHDDAICEDLGLPLFYSDATRSLAKLYCTNGKQFYIGATYWSGDATNSSIWQKQKLVGMLTKSILLSDLEAIRTLDYGKAFSVLKAMYLGDIW